MFYKDWKPIYKRIAKDFKLTEKKEKISAETLNSLLQNRNLNPIKHLKELIENKEVIIFGTGPSLEETLEKNKDDFVGKLKIVADGATSPLLKENIWPDIIVTDLDGKISDQIHANLNGTIAIIHAHGDNLNQIQKHIPEFKGELIGTIQIDPEPYDNIYNFGGFTDGDRAIFIATHFKAKKIDLVGFDFTGEIGTYSFTNKKDENIKLKKLDWCKKLIELLNEKNHNIEYLKIFNNYQLL
jgi:uncharacterized Rossmann fold enzyme